MTERKPTATSNFGVGRREGHDAAGFYARFAPPEISPDETVAAPFELAEPLVCGDARDMAGIADGSVALVVTSPPYFAGKVYEEELDRDGIPSSYLEYLDLLRDVFAECKRVLEPGGRIAVNVANLGRKPYRSLSADVIRILQDDLHLLLRGEVIWQKGEGASGSCAWGSWRKPANPVLRDLTERVVIASKGRFDRAVSQAKRQAGGLPFASSLSSDEFMAATLDVWEIAPESARRVGHPAPFPVELPERLIRLYTYEHDLVLDPFMGSGSAMVAAARLGRRYAGYDLDPSYVELARARLAAVGTDPTAAESPYDRAVQHGKAVVDIAADALAVAGFSAVERDVRVPGTPVRIGLAATDACGERWFFDLSGGFTTTRNGLQRTETAWATVGRALVLASNGVSPLVLLTSQLPKRSTEADTALRSPGMVAYLDALELLTDDGNARLSAYAAGGRHKNALPGFWSASDVARRSLEMSGPTLTLLGPGDPPARVAEA